MNIFKRIGFTLISRIFKSRNWRVLKRLDQSLRLVTQADEVAKVGVMVKWKHLRDQIVFSPRTRRANTKRLGMHRFDSCLRRKTEVNFFGVNTVRVCIQGVVFLVVWYLTQPT